MKSGILKNEKLLYIVFIVGILIILSLPSFLHKGSAYIGSSVYYDIRVAHELRDDFQRDSDQFLTPPRDYTPDMFHYVLAILLMFIPEGILVTYIPILLGVVSSLFFAHLLTQFSVQTKEKWLICLIIVLSPIFMYVFSTLNHYAFVLFLFAVGLSLLVSSKHSAWSLIAFVPLVLLDFVAALVVLGVLALYAQKTKKTKKKTLAPFIILLTVACLFFGFMGYTYGFSETVSSEDSFVQRTITDLGAASGFSLYTVFLFVIGIVATWKHKRAYSLVYVITALLIAGLFTSILSFSIYLNVALCVFAGLGLVYLINRKWEIDVIKSLTIFILILGVLFSSLSYAGVLAKTGPSQPLSTALAELSSRNSETTVLTDPSYGFFVQSLAMKPVIADLHPSHDMQARLARTQRMFEVTDLNQAKRLLQENNIEYILIDAQMRENVWKGESTGLLFLLENSETFKKAYGHLGVELWRVYYD